jgi:hypothetical protein
MARRVAETLKEKGVRNGAEESDGLWNGKRLCLGFSLRG